MAAFVDGRGHGGSVPLHMERSGWKGPPTKTGLRDLKQGPGEPVHRRHEEKESVPRKRYFHESKSRKEPGHGKMKAFKSVQGMPERRPAEVFTDHVL